ncbi:hypothetical protein JK159_04445 [Weissella minor]|uniref:hypothetical protein n=1 Tax=Weissella minor TaxID=1620 RepID=UPI001BAF7F81|nr:hypothetical protein [Weissella minor]MBS0949615.1 hypothetical protein [Weissella minor]
MFKKRYRRDEPTDEQQVQLFDFIDRLTNEFVDYLISKGLTVELPIKNWDTSQVKTKEDKIKMVQDGNNRVTKFLKERESEMEA